MVEGVKVESYKQKVISSNFLFGTFLLDMCDFLSVRLSDCQIFCTHKTILHVISEKRGL